MDKKIAWIVIGIIGLLSINVAFAFDLVTGGFIYSQGSFTVDNIAPVIDVISEIIGDEGDLITINANVSDPNGDPVTISYSLPFNESGQWQTIIGDGGVYQVTVSASDGTLNSTENVIVKIVPYCGDGICSANNSETCSNCATDCGECASSSNGGRKRDKEIIPEPELENEIEEEEEEEEESTEDGQEQGMSEIEKVSEDEKDEKGVLIVSEDLGVDVNIIKDGEGKKGVDTSTSDTIRIKINIVQSLGIKEDTTIKVKYLIIPIKDNIITANAIYDDYADALVESSYSFYLEEYVEVSAENINLIREIDIPEHLKSGKYKLVIVVEHEGRVAIDETEFVVPKRIDLEQSLIKDVSNKLLTGIIAIIVLITLFLKVKEENERKNKEKKLKKRKKK
ncbi:MAG: hypothetical protein U9R08_04615 [Nanoarchaeota archaeon]|nr:hypothetical protein [Nanoarchaeota archaeon]